MAKIKRVIIAGGGTGGHIYPGVAIANEIIKLKPEVEVHFVGTSQGMESTIVPREGFKIHFVRSAKLNNQKGLLKKLKSLYFIGLGILDSMALLLRLRPSYVLGVGGYASGPFVLVATLSGVCTAIWEPNAKPGLANRLLSYFVRTSFLVFSESKKELRSKVSYVLGMPIRKDIEAKYFKIDSAYSMKSNSYKTLEGNFSVLIFCGSQGAKKINEVLIEMFDKYSTELSEIHFFHQVGQLGFHDIKEGYKKICQKQNGSVDELQNTFSFHQNLKVKIFDFIYNMPELYEKVDMVICRGGASSLAEVAANRLPALIIPLQGADNHQEKNAEYFVKSKAAEMILQKNLDAKALKEVILNFKNDQNKCIEYKTNIGNLYRPKAAEEIAKKILFEMGLLEG